MSVFCPNIKSPVWIKHTELVGNDLNYLSWIGNKGYPMELNSKGKPSTLYADLVKEYKDEKLAARIKALTFSKSIMEKLGDVKKDSKGEYKLEDVKKILTLSKEPILQTKEIKQGVPELFESNPNLANQVYEALGFKTKADVILPIGTSGSGKSTFIKSLPQENLVVIEPDAMKVEFTGNMDDKSKDKEIYEEAAKRAVAVLKANNPIDVENLSPEERLRYYKILDIKKSDGSEITLKDINENPTLYQLPQNREIEEFIASEKTIRDLTARMSDRIGIPVRFESDRTKKYKGKLDKGTVDEYGYNHEQTVAVVNLAYATLDTPIHEILGHPIIRAIKGNNLYSNLLKELEYGRGKEVLDRIKRDYDTKGIISEHLEVIDRGINGYGENIFWVKAKTGKFDYKGVIIKDNFKSQKEAEDFVKNLDKEAKENKYTLEEQQEEAIVELLGLMTAEKLDNVKDGKLISLLKRLLKEMKQFVRSLINQREVEIDKLPDNMTLGDIADLLAYSNSKLILPGNEVIYTTPDNQQFKTYAEASNHISDLAKSVEDVDLSDIKIFDIGIKYKNKLVKNVWMDYGQPDMEDMDGNIYLGEKEHAVIKYEDGTQEKDFSEEGKQFAEEFKLKEGISGFLTINKEYEQSKEIIEEWKKVNNIQYNPEEIYSRGQEFASVVGAYSDFDVNLMMQNLLTHIEDNEKAGGKFAISAFTKPVDKQIGHLEGGGGKIKFKIYPQSKDILWAANIDVHSGSVWDASEKVNKDKQSELLGVSYTKYPSLQNVNAVQPNLASIIDNLAYHHNELGISLTGNNFRLEYDEDIPYSTKKIIDSINSILDQKYGKLGKPEISTKDTGKVVYRVGAYFSSTHIAEFNSKEEAQDFINKYKKESANMPFKEDLAITPSGVLKGIQPTQTKETLKESIDSIKNNQLQRKTAYSAEEGNILRSEGWKSVGFNHELEEEYFEKPNTKEYTEQALINTKISKLKEVAKKYPRSLIRSEVKRINTSSSQELYDQFDADELPFQKLSKSPKEILQEKLNEQVKNNKQVVFDTTNLTKDKRLPFIEAIKKAIPNANIQYKLMELNPELAKQRIKAQLARGENRAAVSDETIDRHAASYRQMLEDIKSEPITKYKELGSKQDIEGFKEFTNQETKSDLDIIKSLIDKYKVSPKVVFKNNSIVVDDVEYQQSGISENVVDFQLRIVNSLLELSAPKITKRLGKYGEFAEPERLTIRTNTKTNPNAEINVRKLLANKGVPKEQIDFVFSYMTKNNLTEINTRELAMQIAAESSYTVEVNTALTNPIGTSEPNDYFDNDEGGKPTSYYSNLTVPGGTNYTENEIKTPDITPSIKGHAQFSTDKGIGWFRSDEQVIEGTNKVETKDYTAYLYGDDSQVFLKTEGGKTTKTRRILEVQSDLFQKGRDRSDLVDKSVNGLSENQFLQLLNKDSNWVTFFIKSIVQDSVKKGYEKVLFPSGETAAKIEGHEPLAREMEQINKQLEILNEPIEFIQNGDIDVDENGPYFTGQDVYYIGSTSFSSKEKAENYKKNEINRLEQRKSELKSQGLEKLKPIEGFYEIRVKNILDKTYGKENVKKIIDEYGNAWYEINLEDEKIRTSAENILLSKFQTESNKDRTQINLQEELNTLKEILPDIPVQVVDKLLLNGRAEGMFVKGLIVLSTLGKKGVAYHEAFHAVTQVYLTEEQRNELYEEYRDINGKGISTLDIEEDLAEEFREYMLSKGAYKPYTSKTISWLFDQLDKLLNFLRSDKSRLFNDIRKGRYANSSKYDTSAILYSVIGERINAPADMVNDIVENMAFQFFNRTQLISFNNEFDLKNPEHQARLDNVINEIRRDYADRVSKAAPEVKVNYMKIAKEWKNIVGALKLKLLEYSIDLRIEDSNEGNEEETKERLNIKSSLESSMKDSLPNDVKIMISMLQSKKSSNYFGDNFEVLAPFNESWKLLEDNLTGIVGGEIIDGKQVSMVEAMLNKLKTLSNEYEPFKELYSHLTSSKVPTYKKIQFFSTFSKSNILYEGTLYETGDRGSITVKQMDADTQSKGRQVYNQWIESFNADNESRESVLNLANLKTQVDKFNSLYAEAKTNKTDKLPNNALTDLRSALNEIGIPISKEGLYSYMTTLKGKTITGKYLNLLGELNYVFNSYKNSNSVEDYIHPKDKKGMIDRTQFVLNTESTKNYITDNDVIKQLAKYESRYKKIIGDSMVMGPDGKSYWTKSLNNYLTKQMQTWKTNPAVLENMLTKEYHKYSIWGVDILNRFKNGDTSFDLKVFLFNRLTDSDDTGKTYPEQETGDEIIERMNGVLAGKVIPNSSSYSMLTFADKPVWYKLKGAKFQSYGLTSKESITTGSTAVANFYRYACAEMYRIAAQIKNPSGVVDYKTKALTSTFFPRLSKGGELAEKLNLYTDNGEVNLTEENKKEIKEYIAESLKTIIKEEIARISKAEVLKKKDGKYNINGIDNNILREYGVYDDTTGKGIYNLLSDYILNQTQANIETTFLFTGDGAFYKDLSKRVIAITANGKDLVIGDHSKILKSQSAHSVREKYTISVIKDITKDLSEDANFKNNVEALSEDIQKRKNISKAKAKAEALSIMSPYTSVNQGDGGAMITPERFREVMVGLGLWIDETHDYLFDKIEKEGDLSALHKLVKDYHFPTGQSLKGQHFELVEDKNNRLIPVYLKYAQAVLWAPVVKGTQLEDVKKRMQESKIDELVFESAIKSGAYGIGTIDKFGSNITLSNNNWKLQQDSVSKFEKKGLVTKGTQPVKNIMANINPTYDFNFNGEVVKGDFIIKELHRVESALSDLGKEQLKTEFGLSDDGRILNRERFTNAIVKQLMKDGVSENIWRPIAENPDVPLDVLFSDKIEHSIYSMIKKSTVAMKVNGGAFVQMSNVGFERFEGYKNIEELKAASRNELIWLTNENELRGPTIKDGVVKPGQVFLPSRVLNLIPGLDEKLRNKEITNAELKNMLGDTLELVGYRIPNQNLTSIDSLEVAGILPSFMGDQIVTFTEITAKTGSDFDIDKMFTLMYNVKWNPETNRLEKITGENKEGLENKRIDLWRSILHSKDMFGQVITPLDSEFLKNNAYFIALLEEINKNFIKDKEGNIEKDSNGHYRSTTVEDMGYKTLSELLADPEIENKAVKYFKNKKQSELEFYLPSNQLEIKARNMVGRAGIGQTANHVTHIPLAQQAKLAYNLNILSGRGKTNNEGNTILYSETNENGDLITQVISAWLNAYVDNAKDPYIALINNNTKTAPTVFMLLRAGVDPRWVNMFFSQPIIKKYVENLKYDERRFKEEKFATTITLGVDASGALYKSTRTNTYVNAITKTLMDLGYNINEIETNIDDSTLNSNEKLMKQLIYPDMMSQLEMFKKFIQLQAFANDLNNTVMACKFDTSGAGMDISENLAMEHKKVSASQSRFLDNASVERLFDGTMLETFYNNSSLFAREMLSKEFISSSPKALNTLEHVLTETGNDFSNADLTRKVLKQYKSYVLSGAPILRHSRENIKDMFSPEGLIVSGMKTLKAYFPNNPLNSGFTTSSKKGEHTFVVLPSSKYKDALDAKLMWQEWERLMDNLELDAKLVIGKKGPSTAEKIRLNGKSIVRVLNGTQKVILQETKLKDGEYQLPGGHLVSISNLATNGAPFNINLAQFDTEEKKIAFAKSQGYKDFEDIMNNGQSVWLKEFIDGKPFYLYKCEKVEDSRPDVKVSDYMKELVNYAFVTSGFNKNLNSFYDLIPYTYMRGDFNKIDDPTNLYGYMQDIITDSNHVDTLQTEEIDSAFMNQFLRHNYKDNDFVPEIKTGAIEVEGTMKDAPLSKKYITVIDGKKNGFKIPAIQLPYHWNKLANTGSILPKSIVKISSSTTKDMDLYEYVGYNKGSFYFSGVSKLGTNESGKYIYEYSRGNEIESEINESVTGLSEELIKRLRDTKDQIFTNDFGKMREVKKSITFDNLQNVEFVVMPESVNGVSMFVMKAKIKVGEKEYVTKDLGAVPGKNYNEARNNGLETIFETGIDLIKTSTENKC